MTENLIILKDVPENSGFVVESLNLNNNSISFVHNTETGLNCFNQKSICHILGIRQDRVSKWLNKYKEQVSEDMLKQHILPLRLEINNTNDTVLFYSFDALTYVSYKIDTPEAIFYRDMVNEALNKMFNVAHHSDEINTRKNKLQNMAVKANKKTKAYYDASQSLYSINDKKRAKDLYHEYKIAEAEANKINELLIDLDNLEKQADQIISENMTSKTKQLKLI